MATKKIIIQALESFSKVITNKKIDDDLIDSYHRVFKRTDEDAFKKACFKCIDDLKTFPKVADIRERLIININSQSDFEILYGAHCSDCNALSVCIREPKNSQFWQCKECYSELTKDQIKQRFIDLEDVITNPTFMPNWYQKS